MRCFSALSRLVPARQVGWLLGSVAFSLLRIRRAVTLSNLGAALNLNAGEARAMGLRVYRHLAVGGFELMRAPSLTRGRARELLAGDGLKQIEEHIARGKGLLVLTAHLGHWDLLACASARAGLPLSVITRQIKAGWLDRFWTLLRRSCGVRLLPHQGSAGRIISLLRRGEVLGFVLDQHQPGGLPVPFFGRPAATADSLARLARATDCPVVPAFLVRAAGGRYRLEAGEPIATRCSANKERDILEATCKYSQAIEDAVRRTPEQWLWLHRRWKINEQSEGPKYPTNRTAE